MSDQGWIKAYRKILDNPIATKPLWAWFWIYLLLRANHEDKQIIWNGKPMLVKRGQLLTGRESLSRESHVTEQSVRSALSYLKLTNQVTIKSTNKWSLITIINYEYYQEVTNKTTSQQPTSNQQATTNKNDKNDKNGTLKSTGETPTAEKVIGDFRNQDVNFIIETYKKRFGFSPTDRRPRWVANNMRRSAEAFVKKWHDKNESLTTKGIIEKVFDWYMGRDSIKGETLDAVRRKMKMFFEMIEAKYEKTQGKEVKTNDKTDSRVVPQAQGTAQK